MRVKIAGGPVMVEIEAQESELKPDEIRELAREEYDRICKVFIKASLDIGCGGTCDIDEDTMYV